MEATKPLNLKELNELVVTLVAKLEEQRIQIAELTKRTEPKVTATKEMSDDDARRVLTGDLAAKKHKEAAEVLGLTYGQVYSCRLEFTFKNIHKEMKDAGVKNAWVK